ncbi:RuBisCO large subunit C-terminal-like domain-containing protein [Methanonatronarchaeum sp. AMET6-2]|uniref:RuBisCO large subunit C-terminal-like domain-containing protein n=1 Tax=Methanonatronarchaeum sp. AMET6-2 TaxID=2933293 RepID=UPI00121D9444|nr:RuBisCO large subunit C-terminal-like domain-containing protein [Methanonatronarchaeum sp. AMET6-2]RZN61779.1 MAG: ribulose 1,5-bisphosphate carboxylase [Methanonatronarchaeia archaeon]UOY09365.1 RuBisCO large subunit C-terminal-like domain-containing protein [Methanonatronarchaeum sp. AMET6-2]
MSLLARYYVESDMPLLEAGENIALEESTGTWTKVHTSTDWIESNLKAVVDSVDEENNEVVISFPDMLFEYQNIPQVLSVVAGNLFGLSDLDNVRLQDLNLPRDAVKMFKGPKHDIESLKNYIGAGDRPLVGTIVKPKVGLSPSETAEVAYKACVGGVDLIKDDETLTDQDFCRYEDRLVSVMEALDKAEEETGNKAFYALNITSDSDEIVDRAYNAVDHGANMVMVDVITTGFSALQLVAEAVDLPVHVHRTMHAAMTRNPRHGISMLPISKLVRLCGGTQLHTGSYHGKMHGEKSEIDSCRDALREEWHGLKNVLPVASGGIHPGLVADNLDGYGEDCLIQAGGGIHGHPDGTVEGARAMRQAIDAWTVDETAHEYAETHPELQTALEHWS